MAEYGRARKHASSLLGRVNQVGFGISAAGFARAARAQFDIDAARAPGVAAEVLERILHHNRNTEYGRRHGFSKIRTPQEYRDQVPIITYADIEPDIDMMAVKRRQNVLCADTVDNFMLTSGTSGKSKLIPSTRRERESRIPSLVFIPQGTIVKSLGAGALLGKGMNGMSIAATNKHTQGGTPVSSSLRIGLGERTTLLKLLFSSPICAYGVRDVPTAYYLHWMFAVVDPQLRYLSDEFASKMAFALSVLCERHDQIANDIERGTLSKEIDVERAVRAEVETELAAIPARRRKARARALRVAFEAGTQGVIPRIWPKMSYVACITTGTFAVYEAALREITGALPIYNTTYGLSECSVAFSIAPDDPRYVITPRASYLEYVPEENIDEERPHAHLMSELEVGRRYEIVATNRAGLYRYRTSDVIEVVGWHKRCPIIEFRHRANVLMNFNAEMMTESTAFNALSSATAELGSRLVDYSIRPGAETFPPHYCFYVEVADPIGSDVASTLQAALERHLGRENPRYEDRVAMGRLLPCQVRLVAPGGFRRFEDTLCVQAQERGISAVQIKVPRLLKTDELVEMLDREVT
jgi:hypothetical protein